MHFSGRGDYQVNAKETFTTMGRAPNGTSRKKTQRKKGKGMSSSLVVLRLFFLCWVTTRRPKALFCLSRHFIDTHPLAKSTRKITRKTDAQIPTDEQKIERDSANEQIVFFFFSFPSFFVGPIRKREGIRGRKRRKGPLNLVRFFSQRKIKKEREDIPTFPLFLPSVTGVL